MDKFNKERAEKHAQLNELQNALEKKREQMQYVKTPVDVVKQYLVATQPKFINRLVDQNPSIKEDANFIKQLEQIEQKIATTHAVIETMDNQITAEETKIKAVLNTYANQWPQFIECCSALCGSEVNPVLLTTLMFETDFFKEHDAISLAALLSIFCDIRGQNNVYCEDDFMHMQIELLNKFAVKLVRTEEQYKLVPSIKDTFLPTIVDDVLEWATCEDEGQCKATLLRLDVAKGVSVGDFVKALLKISVLAREIANVCELIGQIDLKHKCMQVDALILKHVATNQSLYL